MVFSWYEWYILKPFIQTDKKYSIYTKFYSIIFAWFYLTTYEGKNSSISYSLFVYLIQILTILLGLIKMIVYGRVFGRLAVLMIIFISESAT